MEYYKNLSIDLINYKDLYGNWRVEKFVDVKDYEGMYKISDLGRVMSLKRKKSIILKPSFNNNGYLFVGLYNKGFGYLVFNHQLVAAGFLNHNRCGFKLVINHIDFNRQNNILSNLEIVTSRVNSN